MKRVTILLALFGLVLGTCVVGRIGFQAVGVALASVRWSGFALLCLMHVAVMALMGLAWAVIVPEGRASALVWARMVRDSAAEVLPLSQLGGFVAGARAATLMGVPAPAAGASTVADVTLEMLAQVAFTALGLLLLNRFHPDPGLSYPIMGGLVAASSAGLGFVVVQRRGMDGLERLAARFAARWLPALGSVQRVLHGIYGQGGRAGWGFALHLAGWVAVASEAWVVLRLMGVEAELEAVLAVESLLYAVRSLAFAVPNAVGVQEGAYLMLAGLFGVGPETVLALSLLKRGRDVAIGVPVLLAWQLWEGRRLVTPPESP